MRGILIAVFTCGLVILGLATAASGGEKGTGEKLFWAFVPPADPPVPAVQDQGWPLAIPDCFILAGLEANGLRPAPRADRRTLIRRATFDLTGLPPDPDDVDAFLADHSPDAFAKLVERLLASPRYGERWGRHWLDLARYADSNGMDENLAHANAYRYRDYVVAAFNADKPYDRFLREQIAGDLMPVEGDGAATNERIVATGFLSIGPKMLAEDDPVKMEMDIVDEQVDTVGRVFLGLTLGCARCHAHKYDPISMEDYYALAGVFKSTRTMDNFKVVARWHERALASKEALDRKAAIEGDVAAKKGEIEKETRAARDHVIAEARARADRYVLAAGEIQRRGAVLASLKPLASGPGAPGGPGFRTLEDIAVEQGLNVEVLRHWAKHLEKGGDAAAPSPSPLAERFAMFLDDPKGPLSAPESVELCFSADAIAALKRLRDGVKALESSLPVLPEAMAVEDGKIENLRVHIRGSHLELGAEAPRRFPAVLAGDDQKPIDGSRSGRWELAEWLARPDHPLTSRVIVNRIWRWHFGAGLVRTPDNFGRLGERPTHPALLDWLARRFVEGGWSVKALHRLILNTAAYQVSSAYDVRSVAVDPENRLRWRHQRQRLEAEAVRDAILAVSGGLDLAMGGTLLDTKDRQYVATTVSTNATSYASARRSLYLPVVRSALYEVLQAFDFADPSTSSGSRDTTTVAPQALFLMNGELVAGASRRIAEGLLAAGAPVSDVERVGLAYRRILGRPAAASESAEGLSFIERYAAALDPPLDEPSRRLKAWQAFTRALLSTSEVIHVD